MRGMRPATVTTAPYLSAVHCELLCRFCQKRVVSVCSDTGFRFRIVVGGNSVSPLRVCFTVTINSGAGCGLWVEPFWSPEKCTHVTANLNCCALNFRPLLLV